MNKSLEEFIYGRPDDAYKKLANDPVIREMAEQALVEAGVSKAYEFAFVIERQELIRLLRYVVRSRLKKTQMIPLYACCARVFVEGNGIVAGTEALVLRDGYCEIPGVQVLKALGTFHKRNLSVSIDANGFLCIERFSIRVRNSKANPTTPAKFRMYDSDDQWITKTLDIPLLASWPRNGK